MRAVLLAAVITAGCASGHAFDQPKDAVDQPDAPEVGSDAPSHPIDAAPGIDAAIDAPPPIDAAIDAPTPIDAPAIDAPPDACVPVDTDILANPALDLAPVGTLWTQQPIQNVQCDDGTGTGTKVPCGPFALITSDDGVPEDSAPFKIWMGGITGADVKPAATTVTDVLTQNVVVPAGTTKLVITGKFQVVTGEALPGSIAFDTANVALTQTNGTPIDGHLLDQSNIGATDGSAPVWVAFTHNIDVTGLSGQTVTLRFSTTNDDSFPTSFYYDTLTPIATHCP